jgi:hypothetical protein
MNRRDVGRRRHWIGPDPQAPSDAGTATGQAARRITRPRATSSVRAVLAALTLATAAAAAAPCEPPELERSQGRIAGREFVLAWRTEPAPLPLGEFFGVTVSACHRSGARLTTMKIDATMPAHRHGMNYLPTVAAEGGGRFLARGLLFHMPGRWELAFDLATDDARETLRASVDLK